MTDVWNACRMPSAERKSIASVPCRVDKAVYHLFADWGLNHRLYFEFIPVEYFFHGFPDFAKLYGWIRRRN